MGNPIIYGLIKSLHDLSSIVWIGSLLFLSLLLVPALSSTTDKKKRNEILNSIFDRLTYFVIFSIIILMITGILEHRSAKFSAFKQGVELASAYKIIHLIKYFLTGLMVFIAILRQVMRKRMKGSEKKSGIQNQRNPFMLIYINSFIGVVIVLLSGILSVFK